MAYLQVLNDDHRVVFANGGSSLVEVNAGDGQYPIDAETQAIGVRKLAEMLAALGD